MSFDERARLLQTRSFASAVLPDVYPFYSALGTNQWRVAAQQAHDVQGLLGFSLGAELGFFDRHTSLEHMETLLRRTPGLLSGDAFRDGPGLIRRIETFGLWRRQSIYEAVNYPIEGAQIAFRSAILPIIRLRRADADTLLVLDRAMFAPDWADVEGRFLESDAGRGDSFAALVQGFLGAFRYLSAAASALRTAYQSADFPHSSMRGELQAIYRTQLDPRRENVRGRLLVATRNLAAKTTDEARRLAAASQPRRLERQELDIVSAQRDDRWEAEMLEIIDRYDDAVNGGRLG